MEKIITSLTLLFIIVMGLTSCTDSKATTVKAKCKYTYAIVSDALYIIDVDPLYKVRDQVSQHGVTYTIIEMESTVLPREYQLELNDSTVSIYQGNRLVCETGLLDSIMAVDNE